MKLYRDFISIFTFLLLQFSCEVKHILTQIGALNRVPKSEVAIIGRYLKKFNTEREKMVVEDLAALDKLTEDKIIDELKRRLLKGNSYSFIGDVLLSLNSNELPTTFSTSVNYISRN